VVLRVVSWDLLAALVPSILFPAVADWSTTGCGWPTTGVAVPTLWPCYGPRLVWLVFRLGPLRHSLQGAWLMAAGPPAVAAHLPSRQRTLIGGLPSLLHSPPALRVVKPPFWPPIRTTSPSGQPGIDWLACAPAASTRPTVRNRATTGPARDSYHWPCTATSSAIRGSGPDTAIHRVRLWISSSDLSDPVVPRRPDPQPASSSPRCSAAALICAYLPLARGPLVDHKECLGGCPALAAGQEGRWLFNLQAYERGRVKPPVAVGDLVIPPICEGLTITIYPSVPTSSS